MNLRQEFSEEIRSLKEFPDYNRIRAEKRFFLIKCFENQFRPKERKCLGDEYRKAAAVSKFCADAKISTPTFYRWLRSYRDKGIKGLIPSYGKSSKALYRRRNNRLIANINIDPQNPLASLLIIRKIIERSKLIPDQTRQSALALLNARFIPSSNHLLKIKRLVTDNEVSALLKFKAGNHKKHSPKATLILMALDGARLIDAMVKTGRPEPTIHRWLRDFNEKGIDSIMTKVRSELRTEMMDQRRIRVIDILHKQPEAYDINRTSWSQRAIGEAYFKTYGETISTTIVGKIIKAAGYSMRRARMVLTSKDPDYQVKLQRVLNALHGLGSKDAFFFIDEAGPWRVKRYGGKALMPPGVTREVPEAQETKGAVCLIAALEALTNQVTWQFTSGKTSREVIGMLDFLREKHQDRSRICLTWDALSSHNSALVRSWIEQANEAAPPAIEVYPLPSNAQFLNVVESTFSNIRRAVIHNSDYGSVEEMQAAISRYLDERNAFYKVNPQRAGNKIWNNEVFKVEELPGGLFRKM